MFELFRSTEQDGWIEHLSSGDQAKCDYAWAACAGADPFACKVDLDPVIEQVLCVHF